MLRNDRRIAVSDWSINQRTSGSTASASTPMVASTTPPIVWRSSLLSGLSPAIALFPSVRQLGLRRVHGAAVVAFDHDHHDSGRVTAGAEDHLRHRHRNGKNDAESKCGRSTRVNRWEAELLRSISSIKQDASTVVSAAQPASRLAPPVLDQTWALDVMTETLDDGRRVRLLTVIDEGNREGRKSRWA
jgi:hypothetical protein